jgi:hypothetical protein
MAHYAFLDENNIVIEVIVGRNEDEIVDGISDWETAYAEVRGKVCKRTSYNTIKGIHITGKIPYRKNYAGIGMVFDQERDAFYAPQPFPSWTLNEGTCIWEAPVSMPEHDPLTQFPSWNEKTLSWEL